MGVKLFHLSKCLKFTWKVNDQGNISKSTDVRSSINSLLQRRYIVAFLGFFCTMVMHSQRVNISIAMVAMVNSTTNLSSDVNTNRTDECPSELYNMTNAKPPTGKFLWSPELQGYIISAGFLGYVLSQIPGGILAGKFGAKKILIPGLLVAAACNFLSPLAANKHPFILLVLTLIRGLAQGVKQPSLSVLMSKWFPRSERGFLSAFIYCGYPVGAFITSIVGGKLCDLEFLDGWPLVFYIFGLWGVVVAILFLIVYHEHPKDDPRITEAELKYIQNLQETFLGGLPPVPWLAITTSLRVYALVLGLFGQYWIGFYFFSVHPIYLGTVLHIPIRQNGAMSSGPYILQAIVGCFTCYLSYWLNRHSKVSVETVRKGSTSLSSIVFALSILGIFFSKCNLTLNELFMYFANGAVGFSFAGALITAVDMSPTFCGPLMGFASSLGCLAGFVTPVIVGCLTNAGQNLTQWGKIFLVSIGAVLGSAAIFQFLGSAEVQPWDPAYTKSNSESKKGNETQQHQSTDVSYRL